MEFFLKTIFPRSFFRLFRILLSSSRNQWKCKGGLSRQTKSGLSKGFEETGDRELRKSTSGTN